LITYVRSKKEIEIINKLTKEYGIDVDIVFQSKEYSSNELYLSFDDILNFYESSDNNSKKYYAVDIIPFNKDIPRIKDLLFCLTDMNFYGVRTEDISVLNIIEENNLPLKVILDSTTGGNNIKYYDFFIKFKNRRD